MNNIELWRVYCITCGGLKTFHGVYNNYDDTVRQQRVIADMYIKEYGARFNYHVSIEKIYGI